LQGARRQNRPQDLPFTQYCAALQGGRFPESPCDRGSNATLLDLVPQPFERGGGRGDVAFHLGYLALQPFGVRPAVALPGLLLRLQSPNGEAERIDCGPALLYFRLRAHEVKLRCEATDMHPVIEPSLLPRRLRRHLCLAVPGPRLVEPHPRRLLFSLARRL